MKVLRVVVSTGLLVSCLLTLLFVFACATPNHTICIQWGEETQMREKCTDYHPETGKCYASHMEPVVVPVCVKTGCAEGYHEVNGKCVR